MSVLDQDDATLQLVLKYKTREMEFSIIVAAHATSARS
jgi:hypothetical protein